MARRKKKTRRQAGPKREVPVAAPVRPAEPVRTSPIGRMLAEDDGRRLGWALAFFLFAPVAILFSQTLPHIYSFGELGFLLPFTVYDIAMAILGLGILCAGFSSERRFAVVTGVFLATLVLALSSFVELWQGFFLPNGLDEQIYLVTPFSVALCGVALWLPERARYPAALVLAVLLACDISLFIGLSEFANDINTFTAGSIIACFWILAAPAFLLRRFRRPWLTIAGRILGSWLVAIELLIFTFAVVPMPANG